MARKKHATNGSPKREKLETFDTGCLPPPCRTLTPERAAKWLEVEFDQWQEFAQRAGSGGAAEDAWWLRESIKYMVNACTRALRTGTPVRLEAPNLGGRGKGDPSWHAARTQLETIAAALRKPVETEGDFNDMRGPLLAMVDDLIRVAGVGYSAESRQFEARRKASEPDPDEYKAIEAEREKLEAERDAAIDVVTKPWDEKIEALKSRAIEIKRQVVKRFGPPSDAAGMLNHALLVSEIERHDEQREGSA